jgi:hypothetical protein
VAPILTSIETAMKTAIDAMTTTGGYNYNWNNVHQPDIALATFPNSVIMIESERCVDESDGASGQLYTNEADFIIIVRGQITSVTDIPNYSVNSEHNKALDDLKKLFGTNFHITNTCDRIMYKSSEREIKNNGDVFIPGELLTKWTVYYRQDRLSPEITG